MVGGGGLMHLLARPLGGSRLVREYLGGNEAANAFFRGSPFRAESYRLKAGELDRARSPGVFVTAAEVVRPAGPRAEDALRRVIGEGGYFVTTGQQPGLFGGPLYSLYKALTAVRLAEDLEHVLARPVMPLFWVASDDHDWAEANHTHVVDEANELVRLSLGRAPSGPPRPLGRTYVGDEVAAALEGLAQAFPQNDFHASYTTGLRDIFRPGATVAAAFMDILAELLRDTTLGLVDAGHPVLKEACKPLFRAEAEDPRASAAVLRNTSGALETAGYGLQAPLVPNATLLFVDLQGGRERLDALNGGFGLKRSGKALSRRRVLGLIDGDPESVSPNVLLRPVVESFLFPTLAYVGGPGELAYFGQLGGLFRRHGVGMPVVVPRASLLVVETRVARVLEKFALTPDEVREADALLSRLARDRLPDGGPGAPARWRAAVGGLGGELAAAVAAVDPALKSAVNRAGNAGLAALGTLEKKIVRAARRKNDTTRARIRKARVNLWPAGKQQDRVLSPFQYLMRYGPEFLSRALREIRLLPGEDSTPDTARPRGGSVLPGVGRKG